MPPPRSQHESPNQSQEFLSPDIEPRKRVTKACDRCRLKKIKCDGQLPCSRCQIESSLCRYSERKKSVDRKIPPGYVEYLEEQQQLLIKALKKLYLQNNSAGSSSGASASADPSINTILVETGVLADATATLSSAPDFAFEEDLDALRSRLDDETDDPSSSASLAETSGPTRTVASSPDPQLSERLTFFQHSQAPQASSAPHTPPIATPAVPHGPRMPELVHAPTWPPQTHYMPHMASPGPSSGTYWTPRVQARMQPGSRPLGDDAHPQPHTAARSAAHHTEQWAQAASSMDWTAHAGGPAAQYGYEQLSQHNFTVSPSDLQLQDIPEDFPIPDDPTLRGWFPENRE